MCLLRFMKNPPDFSREDHSPDHDNANGKAVLINQMDKQNVLNITIKLYCCKLRFQPALI